MVIYTGSTMLELSLGVFTLLALVLALRESAHPVYDEDDEFFHAVHHDRSDTKVYNPEVIMEEAIEEMIFLQAEAVEAVSALAVTLNETPSQPSAQLDTQLASRV